MHNKATYVDVDLVEHNYSVLLNSDECVSTDGLVDVGYDMHFRVDHDNNAYASGHAHSNGIAGFWGVGKTRLSTFHGMSRQCVACT